MTQLESDIMGILDRRPMRAATVQGLTHILIRPSGSMRVALSSLRRDNRVRLWNGQTPVTVVTGGVLAIETLNILLDESNTLEGLDPLCWWAYSRVRHPGGIWLADESDLYLRGLEHAVTLERWRSVAWLGAIVSQRTTRELIFRVNSRTIQFSAVECFEPKFLLHDLVRGKPVSEILHICREVAA